MTENQKKLLLELNSKKKINYHINQPFDILIHSVLNTKLIKIYIDDSLNEVKTSIYSNIEKRLYTFNDNELSLTHPQQNEWEIIQETYLKYVAITRSLNELYLVESKKHVLITKDLILFDNMI